ncbi:hypothetical protein MettiDRAFT_0009 [Methanolobus tindarius DSM 2278]|uniref:Uncharacterized protein n=1 Tax=Methanolobus tindarius DSM 2278 TaxID=1090322 RepID=W9DSG9_METTI|nr:DUF6338 family protein [Methanolobus tindarius]ETA66612.1 hypothetical protein MettiDRAFT_0009 [Methanolobus tindarius DSM 2278]
MASEFISSDIVSILLFMSPGFLTIALVGKLYGIAIEMEQFEKTVWSLIASIPIGIMFVYLNEINSIDSFLNCFLVHPLRSTFEIIVFSLILALLVSLIIQHKYLENLSMKLIHNKDDGFQTDRTVWDRFMQKNIGKAAIVETHNSVYKGWLSANSSRKEKREIVLDSPVIVYVHENGNTEDFPYGKQIILFGEDIKSITILEED